MSDDIPIAPPPNLPKKPASPSASTAAASAPRRGFFASALSVIIGAALGLIPLLAGLATLFDPLRRKKSTNQALRIASLAALPDDGVPRSFPVIADAVDAWTTVPNQQIGNVYLRRMPGSKEVQAFNATCPHAGCMVSFRKDRNQFQCPCHTSAFEVDGKRVMPCVSPRDMDSLVCHVRDDHGEPAIFVEFENFYSGTHDKKAKA